MEGKYLFNPTYSDTEYEKIQDVPYSGIVIAYFVELVNDLINEVNDIAETDEMVPTEDVQEYVKSELEFDREEILQDVTDLLPYGTEISQELVFQIGTMVMDNLVHQYGDAAYP